MGEINSKTRFFTQNESGEWVEIAEPKSIPQIDEEREEEQACYEAWQLVGKMLEQLGWKLVPSERTAQKIADVRGEK